MAYRDDLSHNSWAVVGDVHIRWVSHYRQAVMLLVGMLCHIQDNLSLVRYHMEQVWATYRRTKEEQKVKKWYAAHIYTPPFVSWPSIFFSLSLFSPSSFTQQTAYPNKQ